MSHVERSNSRRTLIVRLLAPAAITVAIAAVAACSAEQPDPNPRPSPLPPQAGCSAAKRDALCIVVVGDSLAAGSPITGEDRWWSRLRAELDQALPNRTVIVDSWGVPGSQINVLESAATEQPEVGTYTVAIVVEGVNDAHLLPVETWRLRYAAAIRRLEARGVIVVVATPPPRLENGAFDSRYDAIAAAVREISAAGRPLLDFAGRWRAAGATTAQTYYVDPIHQSVAGQRLMATMAREVVLAAITGSSAQ